MFLKAGTANNQSRDNDMIKKLLYIIMVVLFASCGSDDPSPSPGGEPDEPGGETKPTLLGENLIVCNEGNWQSDNGQLSFYDGTASVGNIEHPFVETYAFRLPPHLTGGHHIRSLEGYLRHIATGEGL
mgnify:CR=1 FL=1